MSTHRADRVAVEAITAECRRRLATLRARIEAAGGIGVEIVAVTKGHPVEVVLAAQELGLTVLGENYAQELEAKATMLDQLGNPQPQWHFIGRLQTNKVRLIADRVAVWQSVDRAKLGREIANRAPGASCFAQVNLADDPGKGGCAWDDLDGLVGELADLGLDVLGLMGVGVAGDSAETRSGFERLRAEVDRLGLQHCSMGMSGDLETAIAAGSTMLRIGSDIFGPRP